MIFFALGLLTVPYLKIVDGCLLIWIGIKLLQPEPQGNGLEVAASTTLAGAIKTIIVADAVMSLDNVIAIAGVAKDSMTLVVFGLVFSVPIIVWGSKLVMKLMDRYPVSLVIGAALLGWIAGDTEVTDELIKDWINHDAAYLQWLIPIATVLIVVITGKRLAAHTQSKITLAIDLGGK